MSRETFWLVDLSRGSRRFDACYFGVVSMRPPQAVVAISSMYSQSQFIASAVLLFAVISSILN